MIKRYVVTLEQPFPKEECWRVVFERQYRSLRRATRAAQRLLAKHPSFSTRELTERWPWTASVFDVRNPRRPIHVEEAPEHIEMSAGEAGYY